MLYAANYRAFGYDSASQSVWNARDVFMFFATFDYTVFGHNKFLIKDSLLFPRPAQTGVLMATLNGYQGQVLGRAADDFDCSWADICFAPVVAARTNSDYGCYSYETCKFASPSVGGGGWVGAGNGTVDPLGGGGVGWWISGSSGGCGDNTAKTSTIDCGPGWTPSQYELDMLLAQYLAIRLELRPYHRDWLLSHPTLMRQTNNYLITTSQPSETAKRIAGDHIKTMMSDADYYNFVEGHSQTSNSPSVWWEDAPWLSNPNNFNLDTDGRPGEYHELTRDEIALAALYPIQAFRMRLNVSVADAMCTVKVPANNPQPGLNDKRDAFRHAFFQAINVRDIQLVSLAPGMPSATLLVKAFGIAHESEVPSQLEWERVMDLFNNDVGINYCSNCYPLLNSNNDIADALVQKLLNGEMQYLKPLYYSDPYWWVGPDGTKKTAKDGIRADTRPVPTNQ